MNSSRIRVWRRAFLVVALALGLASVSDLKAQVQYEVTDLGTLGGPQPAGISTATGLNDLGQVVGYSIVNNDTTNMHGFLWDHGVMTDLGPLGYGYPTGINDLGQIVFNTIDTTTLATRALVWRRGALAALPSLGGESTFAGGINNLGQIVGDASTTGNAEAPAVIWFFPLPTSRFRITITQLGPNTLGGIGGGPNSISDNGHSVGSGNLAAIDPTTGFPVFHAVAWVNGNMTDLGTLAGTNSTANAVNNSDQITGWSQTTTLDPTYGVPLVHGFIVEDGVMTDLGTTNPNRALSFLANSINRQGQIVGDIALPTAYGPLSFELSGGFTWQNGTMTNLDALILRNEATASLFLSSITAINSRGQIVGAANITPEQIHAVLLTPLPGTAASPAARLARSATPQPTRHLVKTLNQERRMVITVK